MRVTAPHVFRMVLLILGSAICLTPFFWMLLVSLDPSGSTLVDVNPWDLKQWDVGHFEWENFSRAMTIRPFDLYAWNSVKVTLLGILGEVISSSIVGYGFARLRFKGRNFFFILVLAPIFAWLWPRLEQRGWNPSKPAKSAYGLILAGLSFLVLVWSARNPQANGLTNIWWFVLAYFVLEIGEMMLSPIGLSAVTQLSVPRVVGLMMGGWFLGTSYSEILAAELGKLSSIEIPEGTALDVAEALSKYDDLFVFSAWIGIGSGLFVLLMTPLIRRWMHGVR